jgi:hypothetical protein
LAQVGGGGVVHGLLDVLFWPFVQVGGGVLPVLAPEDDAPEDVAPDEDAPPPLLV